MQPAIAIHLAAAVPAIVLGGYVLSRPKGTAVHKALGRSWVGLMLVAAVSSFWIEAITGGRGFSPIHLLAVWTLVSLTGGVIAIRRGQVRRHRGFMIGTFCGLLVAAALALDPARIVGRFFFG